MLTVHDIDEVSIRYTLTLEDGTRVGGNVGEDPFKYTPGQEQIMPVLEEAMRGATKGEKKRIVLAPETGRGLKLDVSRLAFTLGHPGETLVLDVEIL